MKSDVRTTFCPNFDFTVKALMISNFLCHHNFQMNTDMNVKKIGSYTKLCTQNNILASKMRSLMQQKTSVLAPLILKRWIEICPRELQSTKERRFISLCCLTTYVVIPIEKQIMSAFRNQ